MEDEVEKNFLFPAVIAAVKRRSVAVAAPLRSLREILWPTSIFFNLRNPIFLFE